MPKARYDSSRRRYRHTMFGYLLLIGSAAVVCLFGPTNLHPPLLLLILVLSVLAFELASTSGRRFEAQELDRTVADDSVRQSKVRMEELFAMTDMLQSAEGHEDAGAVLQSTSQRLLPEFGGALYVFNNSRDRLDLIRSWNLCERFKPSETLLPISCWAIKRGKSHVNDSQGSGLCCFHHLTDCPSIEIPMMARGNLYGLLVLANDTLDAPSQLLEVERIARALADSMSLALSNIALNEKLKTQSMRDPLTGLYNRRYMEDALERAIAAAARDEASTSVVMIDLDNFKKLNDEHGHAKGDAVLRDVAAHLVGALRPSDTVSRYGGEELILILPNTGIDDAALKAEALRAGLERLSDAHGLQVSASFGIAAHPNSTSDPKQLIKAADEALYAAKHAGKNCVRKANAAQASITDFQPKLVSS